MNHALFMIIRLFAIITLLFPASPALAHAITAPASDEGQQVEPRLTAFGAPLSRRASDGLREIASPISLGEVSATTAPSARSASFVAQAMPLPDGLALSKPPVLKMLPDLSVNDPFEDAKTESSVESTSLLWPTLFNRGASIGPQPMTRSNQNADPETFTDENGHYRFEGLEKGTHKVTIDPSTLPANLQPTEDEPSPTLWVNPGQEMTSESFSTGVRFTAVYGRETGDIAGLVFWDKDGDGQPGVNEPGLSGVRVIDPTIHQYFVPFNDVDLWTLFEGKAACHNPGDTADLPMISYVFLTASSDGTIYYYDHWEDGYDPDPQNPASTTEVGVLDAGVTQLFQSNILTTSVGAGPPYYYDGRDRISIYGEAANVIRRTNAGSYSGSANSSGWLAAAWEVPEVIDWGTQYAATIGEDLIYPGAHHGANDYDYSGLAAMAWHDNTIVHYTHNGSTVTDTLNAGEVYFVDAANDGAGGSGVDSSDTITATAPIQVQMFTGACSDEIVSARGYTLQPIDVWDTAYQAPAPGFIPSCADGPYLDVDTDIYLHNPHTYGISVTVTSGISVTDVNIPAHTTISILDATGWPDLATGIEGTHLVSADSFWGVVAVDSATSGSTGSDDWDWGYSLIPDSRLSSQVVIGYAPGRPAASIPPSDNGNLAFVIAITDTTIYVDLNQDGLPDPFDMNGDGDALDNNVFGIATWDEPLSALGIPLQRGQVLRVGDPYDQDLMGSLIYTLVPGEKIAVAWGQDPCSANHLIHDDLGYTVLPLPIPSFSKVDELAHDADASGDVSPGDTITHTIILFNNGQGPLNNAILTDSLPYTYSSFIPGSLYITTPPPTSGIAYYDGNTWGATPIANAQMFTITWPSIDALQAVTVTFRIILNTTIPDTVTHITNQAVINADGIDPTPSEDPDDPTDPDTDTTIGRPNLTMTKVVMPSFAHPGEPFTYTIVISNGGSGLAIGLRLTDTLPTYLQYVSNTLSISWPIARVVTTSRTVTHTSNFDGFYADDFDPLRVYTGSDGSLDWSGSWTEVDGPTAGNITVETDSPNAATSPNYLQFASGSGSNTALRRVVDLSQFISPTLRYYISGTVTNASGDAYTYSVGTDRDGVLVQEMYTRSYTLREYPVSPMATTLVFTLINGMDPDDVYRFDNVAIYEASPERVGTTTLVTERSVLTYVNVSNANPVSYNRSTGKMVITEGMRLPAGGLITVTFQVTSAIPLTNGLVLTNSAVVSAANIPAPITATVPVTIVSSHALTIAKSGRPNPVAPNGLLTYTLRYTVAGDEPAPNVVITDATPAGTTFHAAFGGLSIISPTVGSTGVVTWYLGDLLPVASGITFHTGIVTMVLRVNPGMSGTITNTAYIFDDTGEFDEDDEITPILRAPGLVITKTRVTDSPVPISSTVQFQIVVANVGNTNLVTVPLTDTYDINYLNYTGATPPSDDLNDDGEITWTGLNQIGPIPVGGSRTITVNFTAISSTLPTSTTDTATASAIDEDGNSPPDVSDDAEIQIVDPSVELNKEIMTPGMVNGVITYAIRITNTGLSALDVIPMYDVFTGPIDYIGGWPVPDEIHNTATESTTGSLVWYDLTGISPNGFGVNLSPGQSFLITTVFRLNIPITSTYAITNTAVVSGVIDEHDNDANEDDAVTAVDLLYFIAQKQSDGVLLTWRTALEVDNYGFRLLRSITGYLGDAVQIAFVPAQGQGAGGGYEYSHLDRDVRRDTTYTYWLIDIDLNGAESYHDPRSVYYTPFFDIYLPLILRQ